MPSVTWVLAGLLLFAGAARADERVVVRVYPLVGNRPVERRAFGVNGAGFPGTTLVRVGGNRITGFNWETGASHAGADWKHQHDALLAPGAELRAPGAALEAWVRDARARGADALLSVPLAGWVAADVDGPVRPEDAAPSARWERLAWRRAGPPRLAPDRADGEVHLDELVRHVVRRFGPASAGGVAAWALDNEPALWPHTHPRLHPEPVTWAELLQRSTSAAEVITEIDPSAAVHGPVLYGWAALRNLQDAPDADRARSFGEAYLAHMAAASERAGRRLLHVFDMHWYPEVAANGARVIGDDTSPAASRARTSAPRSLWDPSFTEQSWIADDAGGPIALLPRLQRLVDEHFPGTRLALSEYAFGAAHHASGGVAQAEALGTLARLGVAGAYWPLGEDQRYAEAAFRLFLPEDDSGAHFGDTVVHATTSEREVSAAFAAKDAADPGRLTVLLLNRTPDARVAADVLLSPGSGRVTRLEAWRFDTTGADLRRLRTGPLVEGEGFTDSLPPLSATLYVLRLEDASAGR